MSEDEKNREIGIATDNPYYVTFQGVANHFPPQHQHPQAPSANYYQRQGYHVVPVYAVAEGRPVRERRLPCCGLMDCREVPGLIACTVASFVTVIVVALGITQGDLGKLTSF
ncbi:hypothetical protein JHK82_036929 [Glycine max]|nr:hypothetical protein JHK85_037684 [Glycine max]KAG4977662.1 hypothetical protein JHK86_037136 [Glycine max]KAG5113660.1 hypothetical protein JHK82_036929 [Glycine max]KAG5130939.1 hypothetical protein JHK84_037336 [Glycine max]